MKAVNTSVISPSFAKDSPAPLSSGSNFFSPISLEALFVALHLTWQILGGLWLSWCYSWMASVCFLDHLSLLPDLLHFYTEVVKSWRVTLNASSISVPHHRQHSVSRDSVQFPGDFGGIPQQDFYKLKNLTPKSREQQSRMSTLGWSTSYSMMTFPEHVLKVLPKQCLIFSSSPFPVGDEIEVLQC